MVPRRPGSAVYHRPVKARAWLALALCAGCQPDATTNPSDAAPLSETQVSVRLILNRPTGDAPSDHCEAEHCRALLEMIDGANKTIDFAIYGMRNRVTHGYFSVDLDLVWKTLKKDIPELDAARKSLRLQAKE